MTQQGGEAQWCLFDPIISSIYGSLYHTYRDKVFLEKQNEFFNRALGQITGENQGVHHLEYTGIILLENDNYVCNPNTPLYWTQANLILAIQMMKTSLMKF